MKLKRCPFCNSHDLQFQCSEIVYWVQCMECSAMGPTSRTYNGAKSYWNGSPAINSSALVADRTANRDDLKEIPL